MSTAAQLAQALQALYHGSPAVKEEANRWLEGFQQSTEAWQVTNDVLHDGGAGMEAHYFCAQTLRTKARRCLRPALRGVLSTALLLPSPAPLLAAFCGGSSASRRPAASLAGPAMPPVPLRAADPPGAAPPALAPLPVAPCRCSATLRSCRRAPR